MPGMVLFGRRWAIASDDLVFPGFFELFLRVLWWIGILTLYVMHRGKLDCAGGVLLSSYLIVLIVLLAVVICTVLAIVCVSMKGTICNPGPRKSMSKLLYIRLALFLPEMVWASLGAAWVADGVQCDRTVVSGIIATVVVSWIIIAATVVTIIIVFDPLGGKQFPIPLLVLVTWIVTNQASYLMASRQQLQACGKQESSCCAVAWEKTITLEMLFRVRQSFSQPTFQTQI